MKKIACLLLLAVSHFSAAELVLDPNGSQLNFTSIKNNLVAELHRFSSLSGKVDNDGNLEVSVALKSVDTRIEIRDKRMQEMLFEVEQFPLAVYKGKVDMAGVAKMSAGEVIQQRVEGTLEMHGESSKVNFLVRIVKSTIDGSLLVSTVEPSFISAEEFGLGVGISKLRKIAGLDSIAEVSPVTFSVVFREPEDEKENGDGGKDSPLRKVLPF